MTSPRFILKKSYAGAIVASSILLYPQIASWISLAWHEDRYSYTLAVPLVSAALVWSRKSAPVARDVVNKPSAAWGALTAMGVLLLALLWFLVSPSPTIGVAAVVLSWGGLFVALHGVEAGRQFVFPLALLLLCIPPPDSVINSLVVFLQTYSAEMTSVLFKLTGMPAYRESAFTFALPGVAIEVAEECSGIRSATSLFVSSFAAAHLALDSKWTRLLLIVSSFPIAIFKNAIRIVTLSWLGVYWDRGYLFGDLHHHGGAVFAVLSIAMLGAIAWILRRVEVRSSIPSASDPRNAS